MSEYEYAIEVLSEILSDIRYVLEVTKTLSGRKKLKEQISQLESAIKRLKGEL